MLNWFVHFYILFRTPPGLEWVTMLVLLGAHFGEHSLRMVFRFHHRRGVVSGAGTQAGREAGWGRV